MVYLLYGYLILWLYVIGLVLLQLWQCTIPKGPLAKRKLRYLKSKLLKYAPYSPDLVSSDFTLLLNIIYGFFADYPNLNCRGGMDIWEKRFHHQADNFLPCPRRSTILERWRIKRLISAAEKFWNYIKITTEKNNFVSSPWNQSSPSLKTSWSLGWVKKIISTCQRRGQMWWWRRHNYRSWRNNGINTVSRNYAPNSQFVAM